MLRHVVRHFSRRRATPRAKREDMYFRESDRSGSCDRLSEFGISLARKADDDIGRNRRPIESLLHEPAAIDESLAPPTSPHPPQNRVAPALHRDMEMWRDLIRIVRHHFNQLARDLSRLDARKSNTKVTRQLGKATN